MKKSEKLVFKWYKKRYWPWYNWKIYHKYLNWRWRKNSLKIAIELDSMFRKIPLPNAETAMKLLNIQPMATPESPIYTLKQDEDKDEKMRCIVVLK